jgi:hypothetical protein
MHFTLALKLEKKEKEKALVAYNATTQCPLGLK